MKQLTDILMSVVRAYGLLVVVGSMLSALVLMGWGMFNMIKNVLNEDGGDV